MSKTVDQIQKELEEHHDLDASRAESVAKYIRSNYLTKQECVEIATASVRKTLRKRTTYSEKFTGLTLEIG